MTAGEPVATQPADAAEAEPPRSLEGRLRAAAVVLPCLLTLYLAFNAGGFFPDIVAIATLVVAQATALRVLLSDRPGAGFRVLLVVALGAMALFVVWTLASQLWSDSGWRALSEANRALLYLLVLTLAGSFARGPRDLRRLLRGFALVFTAICAAGLVTWLLPDLWSPASDAAATDRTRLEYPVTYWNALGLIGALGAILCLHLASDEREPLFVRIAGAAAVPLLAVTLYFTFSRGSVLVALGGLVVYVVLAYSPGVLVALAACLPPTVLALSNAYGAERLAERDVDAASIVDQGHDVALVVGGCMLLAAVLRGLLFAFARPLRRRLARGRERLALRGLAVAVAALLLVGAVVVNAPERVTDAVDDFFSGEPQGEDLRGRFTDPGSRTRGEHWEVALETFAEKPMQGTGAGTFQFAWYEERSSTARVTDGHSLYFEVLGELGLVGLLLIAVVLALILAALVAGLRGMNRKVYAAALAAALAWLVHAGTDWDWEMPVTTVWLFAVGGTALARRDISGASPGGVSARWYVPLAVALLALAAGSGLVALSQSETVKATTALEARDCRVANERALDAIEWFSGRSEPYQVLGYCNARLGFAARGLDTMRRARELDPASWETAAGVAILEAEAGEDPRRAAEVASRGNPREEILTRFARLVRTEPRSDWPRLGRLVREEILASGALTISYP